MVASDFWDEERGSVTESEYKKLVKDADVEDYLRGELCFSRVYLHGHLFNQTLPSSRIYLLINLFIYLFIYLFVCLFVTNVTFTTLIIEWLFNSKTC